MKQPSLTRSFQATGTINNSVEHVFRRLATIEDYRLWVPGVSTSGVLAGTPLDQGSLVLFGTSILGFQVPIEAQVTELVINQRIAFRSVGRLSLQGQWQLWAAGSVTTVRFSLQYAIPGGPLGWATRFADVQGILAAKGEQALENLRRLVESQV